MKKVIILLALSALVVSVKAQIIRPEELENYAKEKYGEKWVEAAENLGSQLSLDKNNALTYSQVIDCSGKTKEQLYVLLNYWFTSTFNDANSVIKLNDRETGTIIAQGYIDGIAEHVGGMNTYKVSIKPIIKCDIKDDKIRVTCTVPFYTVIKLTGGGIIGALSGSKATVDAMSWVLDECFPFAKKDSHKKASSKSLIMAHAYSNVLMDKIAECVTNGLTGGETDNW